MPNLKARSVPQPDRSISKKLFTIEILAFAAKINQETFAGVKKCTGNICRY